MVISGDKFSRLGRDIQLRPRGPLDFVAARLGVVDADGLHVDLSPVDGTLFHQSV